MRMILITMALLALGGCGVRRELRLPEEPRPTGPVIPQKNMPNIDDQVPDPLSPQMEKSGAVIINR